MLVKTGAEKIEMVSALIMNNAAADLQDEKTKATIGVGWNITDDCIFRDCCINNTTIHTHHRIQPHQRNTNTYTNHYNTHFSRFLLFGISMMDCI